MPRLNVLHGLPEGLLDCPAPALARQLGGPTLLHLTGQREPPLLVSVLLHGNETSGWTGLCRALANAPLLARSLVVFIGNVDAAAAGVRTLPTQQDYNRIWRAGPTAASAEEALAAQVLEAIERVSGGGLFAAVDLHNNTGHNPHYAVVTELAAGNLGLAWLFGDKAVHVVEPDTVLTRRLGEYCPAVALELGPIGDPRCADRAEDYLTRLFDLETIPPPDPEALTLFRTRARVHVPPDVSFAFAGGDAAADDASDLLLTGGVEAVNFHELPAGMVFGSTRLPLPRALTVLDDQHRDVTREYFASDGERLILSRPMTPAMYTTDPLVVRQDCLCYLMERMAPGV